MSRVAIIDIIEGKQGIVPTLVRALFYVFSLGFRAVRKVSSWSLDVGMIKRGAVEIPVISIGNIVAGGTGKTPLIEFLGKEIESVSVVSRGYRSKHEKGNAKVDPKGSATEFGDEPLMLAQKFPVYIGKNRFFSAKRAEKEGAKAILLDDGMQQTYLQADLQIGVVRGSDPFGRGHFLPRGYLRDAPDKLAKLDLVVINGDTDLPAIRKYTQAPLVTVKPQPVGVFNNAGETDLVEGEREGF
ncbi:MAG: tetraacyldisaccharide 4'-kinase, partial [Simkaniaceae bacterium]|nr:tetraacyldisaccharide 4'-kinase [Simkaniaceae bacterium]